MKKIIVFLLMLSVFNNSFAQTSYKKGAAFGFSFFYNDFQSATNIRANGLSKTIDDKKLFKTSGMTPGLAINYLKGLTNHIDFAAALSGTFTKYPVPDKVLPTNNKFLLELAATANLKLLSDRYFFTPFLTAGVGASKYEGYYAAFVPLGVGLQFNIINEVFILANSQYRVPVTENAEYHFYHSIGIAGNIFEKKAVKPAELPPPPVAVVTDRDNDGVADSLDKCPDVAGLASLQGCPDKDGDGIADINDKCPDVAGLAKYGGCPIPDTDKDGINDEEDKCPNEPGVARYNGCPIPDTDGDGVNDEDDKCPKQAGPASNSGCPEIAKAVIDKINYAAGKIFFATGSAKLLATSNKSLNEVVKVLKDDPTLNLSIEGHTDNTGKADKNKVLSESRAAAVKVYLKSKGIDESRLMSAGFGQEQPIADNKTAAGRAKNRRVELKVKNY